MSGGCYGVWGDLFVFFFFFNDTATTEIYTLSLHDALLIFERMVPEAVIEAHAGRLAGALAGQRVEQPLHRGLDRKSTRLNSSHW